MKRINIQVDLDDNEIFEKNVKQAITDYIKQVTREQFDEVFQAELERLTNSAVQNIINNPSWWQREEIRRKISATANEFMKEAGVYKEELLDKASKVINQLCKSAGDKVSEAIGAYNQIVSGLDDKINNEIRKRVDIAIQNEMTKIIMQSLAQNQQAE